MTTWNNEQIDAISSTDEIHIAPYDNDGVSIRTPTRIWSVVVDGEVYVRAYNGPDSRWHQAAMTQHAGRIRAGGFEAEVTFTPVDGEIQDRIDAAYAQKYAEHTYLPPMVSDRTRGATVRVDPK